MASLDHDTIAAISTAAGTAGIGIVRVSGPCAAQAVDRVFRAKNGKTLADAESHKVLYGHIVVRDKVLDEVLVTLMRAPRTYTRDDVVEINCHGGSFVLRQVLEAVLRAGARLAQPGEFTKRAFLNGRIDLSQAEAVMDLIASSNEAAAKSALSHLGGALRSRVEGLRGRILHETARIEAALDDPEHYDLTGYREELIGVLSALRGELEELIARADEGRVLREGVPTVILGRPNVGKSTILNLLAGEDRAIVTDIPGTTRDILEEAVVFGGVPLRIQDTAGLRESADPVERIGVDRARQAADEATLVLYVLDGSQILSAQDRANLEKLAGKTVILIKNKADLRDQLSDEEARSLLPGAPLVRMAALDGMGLETLKKEIRERFSVGEIAEGEVVITNLRHKEALQSALESLSRVAESVKAGQPEDLYTVDLMDAYAALGRITGEDVSDDLIEEIFASFCMGK